MIGTPAAGGQRRRVAVALALLLTLLGLTLRLYRLSNQLLFSGLLTLLAYELARASRKPW
jgi:hypothetical protein